MSEHSKTVTVDGVEYRKLTFGQIFELADMCRDSRMGKLKKMMAAERASDDAKALTLAREGAIDYAVNDVHAWATTLVGSKAAILKAMPEFSDWEDAERVQTIALEVVRHPMAPSLLEKKRLEDEAKKKAESVAPSA